MIDQVNATLILQSYLDFKTNTTMIRPIVAYGAPVLKKKAVAIEPDYPKLSVLIDDMWETMYASNGVGLAAPQIGLSVRLFVIDAAPFAADEELDAKEVKTLESFKKYSSIPKLLLKKEKRVHLMQLA